MSSTLESVTKILKDKTRRKIVLKLTEKGKMSYRELMETLKIGSTGTLNYHLKVLGDLLEKDESGLYVLTEKGKLASRFMTEFPEQHAALKTKKVWWRRFWIAAVALPSAALLLAFVLYFYGYETFGETVEGIFGFVAAMLFSYFFYRMIRPRTSAQIQNEADRTIRNMLVSGRQPEEVKAEVKRWVDEEGIIVEIEREDFVRGRLGVPSGLGLTAPKYFEVSWKPDPSGVSVHTEGWISLFDVSERGFSRSALVSGGIPRKKGWTVMMHLWEKLSMMSAEQGQGFRRQNQAKVGECGLRGRTTNNVLF